MIRSLRAPSALRGLGLLVASTLPLAAQADPQTLQPVVVTATRTPQPIDTVLAAQAWRVGLEPHEFAYPTYRT